MNIHAIQSLEAKAEFEHLSATKHNLISAQTGKTIIKAIQDCQAGSYIMTKYNKKITKAQFFNLCSKGNINGNSNLFSSTKVNTILRVLKMKGKKQIYMNGKGLFSLLFPEDFIYEKRNDASPEEPVVRIYNGVLYEGILDKNILGCSTNSLQQVILKEYGTEIMAEFMTNMEQIVNGWMMINGFSIGLEDCLSKSKNVNEEIQKNITKCFIEAKGIEETTTNPFIREMRVMGALGKAKDISMKLAHDNMDKDNNMLKTINSGSKGDKFNLAQVLALLGQQNVNAKRVVPTLNNGKRTLVHYPLKDIPTDVEYESRGFIKESLSHGLKPQSYYWYSMAGRVGICDKLCRKQVNAVIVVRILLQINIVNRTLMDIIT